MPQVAACPVCLSDAADHPTFFERSPWLLRICARCRAVYLTNPASNAELADAYRWTATYDAERADRARREPIAAAYGRIVQPLVRAVRPDKLRALVLRHIGAGKVLDLGCGRGHMMARLPQRIIPFGIEVDPVGAAVSGASFAARGGHVWNAPTIDALAEVEPASMDGAILISYLEHETRPREVLDLLALALKPGARVIIKVPNHASLNRRVRGARWCGYRFPDHVVYFTPATLTRLLNDRGYAVVRSRVTDHLPTSDSMWLVARAPDAPIQAPRA